MTKYLPLKSVSARYGISDRTVDRWIETGDLPPATYIRGAPILARGNTR